MRITHSLSTLGKRAGVRILGNRIIGAMDYFRFPECRDSWGGPFNGQPLRQKLFLDIVRLLRPAAIVETGTYRGVTTEFMAQTGLPLFSIEADPRNYGFACARLWRKKNVKIYLGDSRPGLRQLIKGPLRAICGGGLFFYLDAHWDDDLPLSEEVDIIYGRCPLAVVMIDDFQVPNEPGYGYDDYGSGKALTSDYLMPVIERYQLRAYYPAAPATEEGGL